jgi:hypothetical protein
MSPFPGRYGEGGTLAPASAQSHGRHSVSGGQSGQTQAQPPPVPPPIVSAFWQTPEMHGSPSTQGAPIAIQVQLSVVSARQAASSV